MALEGLLEEVKDRLRPFVSQMFPSMVLLEVRDDSLRGQGLRDDDRPGPVNLEAPLPALTCREGMPLEKESLADLIGDLLLSEKQLDAYVMAVLPYEASHWRVLRHAFPEPPDDPIESLRLLDPPLNLPYSLSEAYVDLQRLPAHPDAMLLVTSPRRLVDAWIDVFRLAGVKLDRLAPAQGCLMAAIAPQLDPTDASQLVALLVPEADDTLLWLFHQGMPVFERPLPAGGDDLIEELQQCLAFYHRQEPTLNSLRLLIAGPLANRVDLESGLGVEAETIDPAPYGSLLLKGLAVRKVGG